MISKEVIKKIEAIVEKYGKAIIVKYAGAEFVSQEEILALYKEGILRPEDLTRNTAEEAYLIGKLRTLFPKDITPQEFAHQYKKVLSSLKEQEAEGLKLVKDMAHNALRGWTDNLKTAISGSLLNITLEHSKEYLGEPVKNIIKEGYLENKSVRKIVSELQKLAGDYSSKWATVSCTETTKLINAGAADAIIDKNKNKSTDEIYVFAHVIKDHKLCKMCDKMLVREDGTPRVFKMSEIIANGSNYGKKQVDWKPCLTIQHPNCFINGNVKIYTSNGWRCVKDIIVGDSVLTHTGKFKKVTDTVKTICNKYPFLMEKKYKGNVYQIKYLLKETTKGKHQIKGSIKVTEGHQFLTQRGWIKVEDLTTKDRLIQPYFIADCCEDKVFFSPHAEMKSSCKCQKKKNHLIANRLGKSKKEFKEKVSKQMFARWKHATNEEKLHILNNAHEKTRESVKNGTHPFQQITKEDRIAHNKIHNARLKSENRLGFQNEHVLKKAFQTLATVRPTKPQRELYDLVSKLYPSAQLEYCNGRYCYDVAIPELKIDIEFDGLYWHEKRKEHDEKRDKWNSENGWTTLRYSSVPTINVLQEDLSRILLNHNDRYGFDNNVIIKSVGIFKSQNEKNGSYKEGFWLYDIVVEDDESFIVNGIVSHNCRCVWSQIPDGWSFRPGSAHLTFIGPTHLEYKSQK